MSLDGFSLRPLADELNACLSGGRIDRISQTGRQDVYMYVRQPGQTYIVFLSINPANPLVNITSSQPENPPEPPAFCMALRKQLEGGRIASVSQYGLDRVLLIDIDTLGSRGAIITKTLVAELMGKYSNLILNQDGTIIDSLRRVGDNSSRVRTVLPGQAYEPPPRQDGIDILKQGTDDFIARLKVYQEADLYRAVIAAGLGIGPVTAKEMIYLAGLYEQLPVKEMEDVDFASLKSAADEIKSVYEEKNFTPVLVLDAKQKIKAMAPFALHIYPEDKFTIRTFASMNEMTEASKEHVKGSSLPEKDDYLKTIRSEINRLTKKAKLLSEDLAKAGKAEQQKIKADNIMTYQYQFKDHGDKQIKVSDIYSGEELTIALDTKLTLMQNAQAYYKKYDKLKRSKDKIAAQIKQCRRDTDYALSIENALESSNSLSELQDIKSELIKAGFIRPESRKKTAVPPSRPFRFALPNGMELYVGKNNYQNDRLTFKTAHSGDIWLHTKDIPGSHVIIDTKGDEPDMETIALAAQIAAYYSKARGSSKVPVDYVPVKFVKKPSGSKPGFVIFTNNKTLYVTPDEAEIKPIISRDLNQK